MDDINVVSKLLLNDCMKFFKKTSVKGEKEILRHMNVSKRDGQKYFNSGVLIKTIFLREIKCTYDLLKIFYFEFLYVKILNLSKRNFWLKFPNISLQTASIP